MVRDLQAQDFTDVFGEDYVLKTSQVSRFLRIGPRMLSHHLYRSGLTRHGRYWLITSANVQQLIDTMLGKGDYES